MKNNQKRNLVSNGGHTIRGFINQEILGIVSFTFFNGVVKNGHFRKKKIFYPKNNTLLGSLILIDLQLNFQ